MQRLKEYDIRFSGLKLGVHNFDYQLDNAFFELFDYHEFERSDLMGHLEFIKKENGLELNFMVKGIVEVPCDITNELFELELKSDMKLVVKFGEHFDDTDEEVLILPMAEHTINVAQYFYEMTVLAVPLKRVKPGWEQSAEGKAIIRKLENLSPQTEKQKEVEKDEIDPRWDRLKDLLN